MRDLNNDLLKEAFNEELKVLVRDFSILLRPIIETIDRFGLKAHFLRKHKAFVEDFYKEISRCNYKSDTAKNTKSVLRRTVISFLPSSITMGYLGIRIMQSMRLKHLLHSAKWLEDQARTKESVNILFYLVFVRPANPREWVSWRFYAQERKTLMCSLRRAPVYQRG